MTDDNVVQLPTLLERLAGKLKTNLAKEATNREEWIFLQEEKCFTLAEIRDEFKSNEEFGLWCENNSFGADVINHQTRAAAIAMGREPEALRKCLEATDRWSLEAIYRFEFERFTNVRKTPKRPLTQRVSLAPSPQTDKAKQVYDDLKAKGEPVTINNVARESGVSRAQAGVAVAAKREEEISAELTPAELREKRFQLAVKNAQLKIREELRAEVYKEMDPIFRHLKERSDRADRILSNFKGVMSKENYRKIKACLHPDHNTFKFAAEALQIFSELEPVLVKPDDPVYTGPPLPQTAAELMARRKKR